jgi:hypothetical protein
MQTGRSIADRDVPLTLNGRELLDRGHKLARELERLQVLESDKANAAKKYAKEIKECEAEIGRLKRLLLDGWEKRDQLDLFVDQSLPPAEVQRRLAELEARSSKHPFSGGEGSTCAHVGCTAAATDDVHIPPLPSEFHTFVGDKSGEDKCWACGSGKDDPIHTDPEQVHAFIALAGDEVHDEPRCVVCEELPLDVIHAHAFDASVAPEACARCQATPDHQIHAVDPHHYSPESESGDPCGYCGRDGSDAIHIPIDPTKEHHAYEEGNDTETCLHCGGELDDPKHVDPDHEAEEAADAAAEGTLASDLAAVVPHRFESLGGKGLHGEQAPAEDGPAEGPPTETSKPRQRQGARAPDAGGAEGEGARSAGEGGAGVSEKVHTDAKYVFTPEMGEISGFGGGYEEMCRTMLRAGMEWLDAHPEADPHFKGYQNVFGVTLDENADAKALSDAVVAPTNGDCTGAMHQAVITACLFIRKNGWDEYVRQMSAPERIRR